jgi:hypothetical protein
MTIQQPQLTGSADAKRSWDTTPVRPEHAWSQATPVFPWWVKAQCRPNVPGIGHFSTVDTPPYLMGRKKFPRWMKYEHQKPSPMAIF